MTRKAQLKQYFKFYVFFESSIKNKKERKYTAYSLHNDKCINVKASPKAKLHNLLQKNNELLNKKTQNKNYSKKNY